MKCDEIRESLGEYADRELSPPMLDRVREHLADCKSCAAELQALERLEETLRSVPAGGDEVRWDGYLERVRARTTGSRRFSWRALVPVAAAVLMTFGLARMMSARPPPPQPRALLERYAAADAAGRAALEREAARLEPDGLAFLAAAMVEDPDAAIQRAAGRLLASRADEEPVRRLLLARSAEASLADADEVLIGEIGTEPSDADMVAPALEMAKSSRLFADAVRVLRKLDRGGLNRTAHGEIVRRVRELLSSDMPQDRELGVRLVGALEILVVDVVEFLDVPDLAPQVLEFLRRRTSQDFGTDKKAWRAWFARKTGRT